MANSMGAYGLMPIKSLAGRAQYDPVTIKNGYGNDICPGDLIKKGEGGYIVLMEPEDTDLGNIIGVFGEIAIQNAFVEGYLFNSYYPAHMSTKGTADIVASATLNPEQIYSIKCLKALDQSAVYQTANFKLAAAPAPGVSRMVLDGDTLKTNGSERLLILGLVDSPNNDWGAGQDLMVMINKGLLA